MTKTGKTSKVVPYSDRIESEKSHGEEIALTAQKLWNWEGPIGTARYQRRAHYLARGLRPGVQCLEIGCGTGMYTESLVGTGAKITAVDISNDLLMNARKRSLQVNMIEADICRLPFRNEYFDEIVGSSILHHLDIDLGLKEIYRVLKKGGRIRFTEPNYLNLHVFLERKIPFLRKKLGVSKYETAFIRWDLKNKLLREGFREVTITPFDFMYPFLPGVFLGFLEGLTGLLEKTPLIREIAGSLQITAGK
jgi:SAM-dependent methyltransferase